MTTNAGKYMVIAGIILLILGVIFIFFGDKLTWIGKLPGDIRYEGENTKVYFPITTMILISIIFTILLNLVRKF